VRFRVLCFTRLEWAFFQPMTTQETKHTPGPWILKKRMAENEWSIHQKTATQTFEPMRDQYVGTFCGTVRDQGQAEANAALIASAPDLLRQRDELLEACKRAHALMELAMANDHSTGSQSGIRYADCETLRQAIAACEKGEMAQ